MSFQVSSAALSGVHGLGRALENLRTFAQVIPAFVARQDHRLERHAVCSRAGLDAHRVADGAAAELQDHVLAQIMDQLVHLTGMDAARCHRHHLVERSPVLLEEQAMLQALRGVRIAQRVVEALDHERDRLRACRPPCRREYGPRLPCASICR